MAKDIAATWLSAAAHWHAAPVLGGEAMSEWRPEEGWENPYGTELVRGNFSDGREYVHDPEPEHDAYEAGADAMLEALREDHGVRYEGGTVAFHRLNNEHGTLVFIPDEE